MSVAIQGVQPKGLGFARSAIALALAVDLNDAAHIAEQRWGELSAPCQYIKTAVAPLGMGAAEGAPALASVSSAQEFFASVLQGSIIGRLVGRREVPLNTRLLTLTTAAIAYWVSSGTPKPLTRFSLVGETLPPLKEAALVVTTAEVVKLSNPQTEQRFNADLQRALIELMDQTFIDPANAGVADESPASITSGVTPIASTGDPGEDIAALIGAFGGDLASAFFICDPTTAAQIALARDAGGGFMFPDCGPRGGSILGIPLLTSRSSPRDSSGGILVLLDASSLAVGIEGITVSRSEQATIEMQDEPTDPPTAATVKISLWQADLVGFLCEVFANWKVARSNAVAYVSDATYSSSAT